MDSASFIALNTHDGAQEFSELTNVQEIGQGGFGVIHRAKHARWGSVVYKELKCTNISESSRFASLSFHSLITGTRYGNFAFFGGVLTSH